MHGVESALTNIEQLMYFASSVLPMAVYVWHPSKPKQELVLKLLYAQGFRLIALDAPQNASLSESVVIDAAN